MMNNHHLRGIILKLENRLSDDDRKRLHFFLSNDVPRRIRDDPSLSGTLSLMESLFDQDKINEQDFTFLINAFDEIQCMDAVKLLRDHMRRMQQSNRLNQSIQSLASIMPPTIDQSIEAQDEDRYAIHCPLIIQRNISENSIEMIGINNTDISPVTEIVDNQSSGSNRKKLSNRSSIRQKCLLLFVLLLSIIGLGALTGVIIFGSRQFIKELKMKDKSIFEEQAKNNQILKQLNGLRSIGNGTKQQLIDQLEQSRDEQRKQNEKIQRLTNQLQQSLKEHTKNDQTMQQLHDLRTMDNRTIQQLTNQLKQSLKEQAENNQTIQQITDQFQQSRNEQRKQNETIQQLHNLRSLDNQKIQKLTNQLKLSCEKRTQSNKNNVTVVENDQADLNQTIDAKSTQKLNTKWKQRGVTIAGGNGFGNQLNQLYYPKGIFIDDDQTIYIADWGNHRIVEWKSNATNGRIVAGENGEGNSANQLNRPTDVIIDKETNSLIISEEENRRVMRWSRHNNPNGQIIIEDIDCSHLTMDKNGSLYISDSKNDEVRRWKRGEKNKTIVAGGNGEGDNFNQLNYPTFIFVDDDHSLYVSDTNNHRVMKWLKNAKEGIIVAGGYGRGNGLTQLSDPKGIIVDQFGQIYVADCYNNRVMRWYKKAKEGTIVVGGNGKGQESNQLSCPASLSFDRQGNLFVVDLENHRIQKFEIDK